MVLTKKADQGGSVVFSILLGILLVIILFSAIYIVRQRSDQARREQAIADYDKQKEKTTQAVEKEPSTGSDETATAENEQGSSNQAVTQSADLPNTGPSSPAIEMIGIFAITASFVGYFESRRNLARYL